jgi:enediyne biosynthesis protein E4
MNTRAHRAIRRSRACGGGRNPLDWENRTAGRVLSRAFPQVLLLLITVFCSKAFAAPALNWQAEPGGRSAALPVPAQGKAGFVLLGPGATGINFTNTLSGQHAAENQIRLNGSGVAAGDVDGDGWCDLYFCSLEGGNKLYRNLGNWRFVDITEEAGVGCTNQWSTGAVFADIDGDGDLDLLVNGIGVGTRCFINDGKGHFTESTNSGLLRQFGSMSMALADIDGDGTLDLYVANYRTTTVRSTGFSVFNIGGKRVIRPEDRDRLEYTPEGLVLEHGEVDAIYLNDGQGHFTQIPWTGGTFLDEKGQPLAKPPRDWGLTVAFRDLNGDLAPDIYVSNDFQSPDRVWINDGHGHFRALATLAIRHTPTFSMAVDFADIDRDGYDDFLALDMLERTHGMQMRNMARSPSNPPAISEGQDRPQIDRNTLQRNRGDGTYAEISHYAGLEATGWSWSLCFLDVDLDGYEDVLFATGNLFNPQDLDANAQIEAHGPFRRELIPSKLLMYPPLNQPRLVFRNRGDLTFQEIGAKWGFDQVGIANGMAMADLDNDGDLDLIVNNMNSAAGLYRNESNMPRVAVRLKGLPPNTHGIGAKIKFLGGPVPQSQEMICGGRYLSGDDAMRVFAAGNLTNDLRIEVAWRSGRRSTIEHARANREYEIEEAGASVGRDRSSAISDRSSVISDRSSVISDQSSVINDQSSVVSHPSSVVSGQTPRAGQNSRTTDHGQSTTPWLQDVSDLIAHTHCETAFDDFSRQPLLPNKLSQLGPGVSWFDVDADGWEDLIIGSGRGGQLAVYRNDGQGGFRKLDGAPFSQAVTRDQSSVLGWRKPNGETVLLAGSANYEDGLAVGSCVRQYDLKASKVVDTLPGQPSSTGPLALGDMDGAGVLDLFVGGRVLAGQYPAPASSLLFRSSGGQWTLNETDTQALQRVGLVSGAVWSDLDGDGLPELVLACEWGPLRVFSRKQGKLREITGRWGLDRFVGWWTGVTVGDFDGDGRLDLVASNWGLNTSYRASPDFPRRLYYTDFDGNGTLDLVESYFDQSVQKWVPTRDLDAMAAAMPFLRDRFSTHRTYSEAGVQEIFGDKLASAKLLEANTLASMVFLNRGDHFEAVPLPPEAQFSPAFGITVADFDGDGKEDIVLSQNFFATQPQTPRNDAGRGLLLKGDGTGHFTAVPGQESGLRVYGEQRGCACADYDHDGRVDLVLTQNGAATKLFHNSTAKPGLRVRLSGPAGNPEGIGAAIQLKFHGYVGPLRELHSGSGYWSQDGAVQVMATPEPPVEIEVRWPGGKRTATTIPANARELSIDTAGHLTNIR